ncbi:hypothetical protein HPB48_022070 [Haemaphysalis longicornis]|uniref:Uncharacterized protein n=1 Tax=Haemaphysalis longicornis TaxID=44386 RepID=A0A9J6FB70_HAELO|nr:hypothetical protein HPB48_022070 [Haemaphysalis longicornis]
MKTGTFKRRDYRKLRIVVTGGCESTSWPVHVVDGQWFFDGRKCSRWGFPRGTCLPAKHRGVFGSLDDCRRQCVHRSDRSCGEVPPAETCSLQQLRHAYFADMQAKGGVRCVNTSRRTRMNLRCLIRSNQFPSFAACRRICGRK